LNTNLIHKDYISVKKLTYKSGTNLIHKDYISVKVNI